MNEEFRNLNPSRIQRQTYDSNGYSGRLTGGADNFNSGVDLAPPQYPQQKPSGALGEIIVKDSKRMNVCQWIGFGILLLTFMFLVSFIIYQAKTWDKVRINRYG